MYMETGFRHIQFLLFNQFYFFNFETLTRTLDTTPLSVILKNGLIWSQTPLRNSIIVSLIRWELDRMKQKPD